VHFVKKTYGHEQGLSACFRQHRAKSHCRFLHGYPLSFAFTFASETLDENGWVIDFGSLKPLKAWLCDTFDHKMLVAHDDPAAETLRLLGYNGGVTMPQLADVLMVEAVGCEAFARMAWQRAEQLLDEMGINSRVSITEVEVREHASNGVIYTGER
jgi:6-pyruvoyltetrahydropterin/6-carboxytetrahydropterin synthase